MDLLFAGDVMLGRLVNETLKHRPPASPWGDTLPIFRSADWRMCNLECVIADRGTPWTITPKVFHFRSDARNVAVLRAAAIDAVSLANNHTLDFGYDALSEMLGALDGAGIRRAGAGRRFAEASSPAVFDNAAGKLAVIAFSDNQPDWEATDERPGIFYVPVDVAEERARRLFRLVGRTREDADLLVVSAHWGPNWGYAPPPNHVPFARALIDAGADVVFGHSGHVCRGVEIYRGRPIVYCAGDFVDDYAVDLTERNDRSFIFVVRTDAGRIRGVTLHPTVIRDFQARRARGRERGEIVVTMQRLCADLGTPARWTADEGCLEIEVS